ncbi:MAG: PP2C family serine/threonine-protein phosphatase [Candidatus Kariarchaeaceae archaeon]|jgi:serine/threonine protein phosphatase PrpC
MNDSSLFKSFIKEFDEIISLLVAESDSTIDKDILSQIVETIIEKYNLLYLNSTSKSSFLRRIISKFNPSEHQKTKNIQPLIEQIKDKHPDQGFWKRESSKFGQKIDYNHTDIPSDLEVGLILDPYPSKDQDHVDYRILPSGSIVALLCDGISGEGELSGEFARALIYHLLRTIENQLEESNDSLEYWEQFINSSIENTIKQINFQTGASTMIIALISADRKRLYFGWLGDGNALIFNENLTGFSKILYPQRDNLKRLTTAVTANGIIGHPIYQLHNSNGGTLILSSDGFDLSKGAYLNHLYKSVLRSDNPLQDALDQWVQANCCQGNSPHPKKTDDRSMIIIRWQNRASDK